EFRSSEYLIAAGAFGLSEIILRTGEVDIRIIGAIHSALFLLAIYLFLPVLPYYFGPRAGVAIVLTIALVLCDVMYVSLFNSFYMDAAALVFFPLPAVFFLRSVLWKRSADVIGLAICSTLLAGAKAQHAVLAIPLVILLIAYR